MVYSTKWVASVARNSADLCQYAACNPERLSSDEALNAIFCLPIQCFGRLVVRMFSFFCFPLEMDPNPRPRTVIDYYDSSSSSSSFSQSELSLEDEYMETVDLYHSD